MAELKALSTPAVSAKEAFVSGGAGKKTDGKKRPQVKKLSDNSGRFIKIGLYGDYGTGKTYSIVDLVEKHGLKVLVLSTDVGGDGLSTVIAELNARGRTDLADTHVRHITLETYEEFVEFTEKPELYFPDIYDWDPDFVAWDGFSGFQQYQLSEYVDGDETIRDRDGNTIPLKYWGAIKNATSKNLNRFLYLHNRKSGKLWHKLVTMLSTETAKDDEVANATSEAERLKLRKDVKAPLVQGAAAKLIGPAFDFFALCTYKPIEKDGKKVKTFLYEVEPTEKRKAKVRGVRFEKSYVEANMGEVWKTLTDAYLVKPGQISQEVKDGE